MLYPKELLFDDSTPDEAHEPPDGYAKGYSGRRPEGYGATTSHDFPTQLLIPRSEWQARIEEREKKGTQLSAKMIKAGLPCKNQESTNYCWINAPAHTMEITRVLQNEPMVIFSPASGGAVITNFRNVGGWGKDALDFIATDGLVPVENWPANAIDKRYHTQANIDLAKQYRVDKWLELVPRNLDQLVSMLLRDIPVAVAYNWWGHEVTAYDAVWVNGQIGIRPRNSWGMDYGHLGFFTVQGNKMYADDAVCPLTATAA